MTKLEEINKTSLYYNDSPTIHTKDYYHYCLKLLKEKLSECDIPINLLFSVNCDVIDEKKQIIKCDIQVEHTLVKNGGRGVLEYIYGDIKTKEGENYLIRVDDFNYFQNLDFVIEYSMPNIVNLSSNKHFEDYLKKIVHISPITYDTDFEKKNNRVITLYKPNDSNRRLNISQKLIESVQNYENISNIFEDNKLIDLYKNTKILVNVHQTDHHHTFEELRVLPALCRGVIIISETVPLKETLEYNEFIVWADYEDLINKTIEVQNNYEYYYNKIFNKKLEIILNNIKIKNKNNLNFLEKWKQN
jgi:hypothetical protein